MNTYDQIKEAAFREELANIAQAGGLDFLFDEVAEIFDVPEEEVDLLKSAGALDALRGFAQSGAKAVSGGASALAGKASKAWHGGSVGGVPMLGVKGQLQQMNPFAGMGKSLSEAGGAFKAAPNFKALAAEGAGAAGAAAAPASRAAVAASAPAAKPLTSRLAVAAAAPAARRGPSMGSLVPAAAGGGGGGRGYPSPFDH